MTTVATWPHRAARAARALAVAASLGSTGCLTVEYVTQAALGQIDLMDKREPISRAIHDPTVPPRVRALLAEIRVIKAFGEKNGLKPTKSYEDYVDVGRSTLVWVVTACEPLRFKSKTWRFPIAGSVQYLGWFDKQDADDFARELREDGWDVDVRGSMAYSTLGWFDDPVLSTMIPEGEETEGELVDVVLHESVHATLYIPDQTPFNESIATFIARELTPRYFDERRGPGSKEGKLYQKALGRRTERAKAMHEAFKLLERLYAQKIPRAEMLAQKSKMLDQIRKDLRFSRPINNATLAQSKSYNSSNDLERLYNACGKDVARTLEALRALKSSSFREQHQRDLAAMMDRLAPRCASPTK